MRGIISPCVPAGDLEGRAENLGAYEFRHDSRESAERKTEGGG